MRMRNTDFNIMITDFNLTFLLHKAVTAWKTNGYGKKISKAYAKTELFSYQTFSELGIYLQKQFRY